MKTIMMTDHVVNNLPLTEGDANSGMLSSVVAIVMTLTSGSST